MCPCGGNVNLLCRCVLTATLHLSVWWKWRGSNYAALNLVFVSSYLNKAKANIREGHYSRINTPGEMTAHDCQAFNASVNAGTMDLAGFIMKRMSPLSCDTIFLSTLYNDSSVSRLYSVEVVMCGSEKTRRFGGK
jgi:hypothetical protein